MRISYNWLNEYIDCSVPPEELAQILVDLGLEVESMDTFHTVKGGMEGFVIGEVKTCGKHPNADKLSVTTVDIGIGTDLNIVCGAPNIAAGQKVVVSAPAFERHAQRGRSERGAHQHAVTAPGQAALKPTQGFVVQFAHGQAGGQFKLQGGDAAA